MKYQVLFLGGMFGWSKASREFSNPYTAIQYAIGVGTNSYMEWMVTKSANETLIEKLTVIAQDKCLRLDRYKHDLLNAVLYGL